LRHGVRRVGVILALLAPSSAWAQLAPVGVPAGVARLELEGAFEIWDHEFVAGEQRPLGARFTTSALGSSLIPSLSSTDALIRSITGNAGYSLSLGALTGDGSADRGTAMFGASIGLTQWLTIFGRIPYVRSRVQTSLDFDPESGEAGLTPDPLQQDGFFQEFDNAINTLSARIAAGVYDGNPSQRALADATLASGTALRDDLSLLLSNPETASPFVPVATSAAGGAITQQVTTLQGTLSGSLGVTGFSATPILPSVPATSADILAYLNDPTGAGLRTGESLVSFRGDAEAGVGVTLVDGWDRGGKRGGFRAAVEGLIRFPTGSSARANQVLGMGTGDGQTDVEVRGTVDVGSGLIGARLEAGYNRQLAADFVEIVASQFQPFAGLDRLTNVHRDPGDVTTLGIQPFFRLARTFAIIGQVELQSRQLDEVTYVSAADSIPGVDASVLAEGTDGKATYAGIGVTYSNPGARNAGGRGLPVDAGWTYERVLSSSRGIVPDVHRVRARLRVYFGLF
jgi:hypothetical protein